MTLRTAELTAWCRSRDVDHGDEEMLRAVFEERDQLLVAAVAVLEHINRVQEDGESDEGADFYDGADGTDARHALEQAIALAGDQP